ncbi:hypothetical protein K7T73_09075 [Bacillus badius]|nr:hypothetical protein K7T73_09075 [Bacillus badius]
MAYIFLAVPVFVVSYSIYRMIKKKTLPSNRQAPFDDLMQGKSKKE